MFAQPEQPISPGMTMSDESAQHNQSDRSIEWHGLVARWPMNEAEGQRVADVSGNGHHGDARYTAWSSDDGVTAIGFDGVNSRVVVADHTNLRITGDISICVWLFKLSPNHGRRWDVVLAKTPGLQDYELLTSMARSDEMAFYSHGCAPIETYGGAPIDHGTWQHVAVTRHATEVCHYRNGAATGTGTMAGAFPQSSGDLLIGHDNEGGKGHGLRGMLRELWLFDRALTATEVGSVHAFTSRTA